MNNQGQESKREERQDLETLRSVRVIGVLY